MATSPQEVAQIIAGHRLRRATALVDALRDFNYTLDEVRRMTDHGWHIVAVKAKITKPSPDTQALVIQIMEKQEQGKNDR